MVECTISSCTASHSRSIIVWHEVARLLEDPTLIEAELTRRLEAAQTANPAKRHQDRIASELVQLQRRAERLLTSKKSIRRMVEKVHDLTRRRLCRPLDG